MPDAPAGPPIHLQALLCACRPIQSPGGSPVFLLAHAGARCCIVWPKIRMHGPETGRTFLSATQCVHHYARACARNEKKERQPKEKGAALILPCMSDSCLRCCIILCASPLAPPTYPPALPLPPPALSRKLACIPFCCLRQQQGRWGRGGVGG